MSFLKNTAGVCGKRYCSHAPNTLKYRSKTNRENQKMNKVVEKWDEILQIVKTEHDLSDVSFNTWLKPLTVYEVVDNVVTIIVPSEQVGLNYISKKYKLPLRVTISDCRQW